MYTAFFFFLKSCTDDCSSLEVKKKCLPMTGRATGKRECRRLLSLHDSEGAFELTPIALIGPLELAQYPPEGG